MATEISDQVVESTDTLLERITGQLPSLRRSEKKVAEFVLADPTRAVTYAMAGLAEAAGVSEPTVMRFCASIGCDGFQDFRIQLSQTLALGLPLTHSAILENDSPAAIAEKIFDHTISSLDRARRNLNGDSVAEAVRAILAAREMLFVGFGASGIIAQDAQQKFPLFGIPCQAPSDLHQQFIAAAMSGPGGIVVAISNTGHTVQTLTVARAGKEAGALLIAIVGQESPLSELADITLLARTFEDTEVYTPSTSRLAGLVVVDILATCVAMQRSDEHQDAVRRMKHGLSLMRQNLEDAESQQTGSSPLGLLSARPS